MIIKISMFICYNWLLNFTHAAIKSSTRGFPGGTSGKEPTCQCRRHKRCGFNPWIRKIPWRRAWHSSILAWGIPWTEEPGGLQSIGLQRVRHIWRNSCTLVDENRYALKSSTWSRTCMFESSDLGQASPFHFSFFACKRRMMLPV